MQRNRGEGPAFDPRIALSDPRRATIAVRQTIDGAMNPWVPAFPAFRAWSVTQRGAAKAPAILELCGIPVRGAEQAKEAYIPSVLIGMCKARLDTLAFTYTPCLRRPANPNTS